MRILRFNAWQRAFHWSVALPVVLLIITGLTMTAHSLGLLPSVQKQTLLELHRGIGAVLMILSLLIVLLADRDVLLADLLEAFSLSYADLKWAGRSGLAMFNKDIEVPPAGKFNGGQKMNAVMSLVWLTTLCLTGLVMSFSKGNVLAHFLHIGAFMMFIPGLLVHLFMATINPETRSSLGGMIHGHVDVAYLKHHHALFFQEHEPRVIGNILVSELAGKKDMHEIYQHVYKDRMTFAEFAEIRAGSEVMIVAKEDGERMVLFFRVVGDGVITGFIVDLHKFDLSLSVDVEARIIAGAESLVGHPIRRPE